MKRHNLSNRRPTTTCQKEPAEYQQKLVDYILFISKMRRQNDYKFIFASDETAVFIDASHSLTVTEKGAKEVNNLNFRLINFLFLGANFDYRTRQNASNSDVDSTIGWFQMSTFCFAKAS